MSHSKHVPLVAFTALILTAISKSQGGETTDNTEIIKSEFIKAAKKCSMLHTTNLVQVIALFSERETNDREGKCFLLCMLRQYNLMDKEGNYNMNKFSPLLSMLPVSRFVTSIQSNLQDCLEEDSSDPCEKAFRFLNCFYKKGMVKPEDSEDRADND